SCSARGGSGRVGGASNCSLPPAPPASVAAGFLGWLCLGCLVAPALAAPPVGAAGAPAGAPPSVSCAPANASSPLNTPVSGAFPPAALRLRLPRRVVPAGAAESVLAASSRSSSASAPLSQRQAWA